jgi:hypothetical protein
MDSLPEQIKNNIVMYSVPHYPYLNTLKKVNKSISELEEGGGKKGISRRI